MSRPEASIAKGYLAENCIIFCSRFLNNDGTEKITKYFSNLKYVHKMWNIQLVQEAINMEKQIF